MRGIGTQLGTMCVVAVERFTLATVHGRVVGADVEVTRHHGVTTRPPRMLHGHTTSGAAIGYGGLEPEPPRPAVGYLG